ncbi:hypothetical protein [Clostridium sp. M14]|uniref:hypothetical protein n=1 Tax=Clostridium sp. M14 TaxID=2716311 RepID=UPI0013EEC6C1|nr:hypothetical protein [Clostridium sp. M14]MBZ9693384.1 hypothetical protein [Clostridium sp. M14]
MCKIKIVDSIPGSGKTSAIINMINNDTTNNKYIYITPFLTEVERVKKNCKNRKFQEPKYNQYGNKFDNLNKLISEGKNIVSTHALFHKANMQTVELLKSNDYILILDEVFNVIEQCNISKNDVQMLINDGYAKLENDYLVWNEDKQYTGAFENIKYLAINRSIIVYKDVILIWMFPVEIFKAFKDSYILTYLFEAQEQCYYYKMNNIEYEYYYAMLKDDTYTIKLKDNNYKNIEISIKNKLKDNINIIQDDKLNAIGYDVYNLSHSWFRNELNKENVKQLKSNITNFFINKIKAKSNTVLWTTFKDQQSKLKGKGYTKGFIACNLRATNDYVERYNLAYCINIFNQPFIDQFFKSKDIIINQELYALSELIQWLWRSRIRRYEPINIYIPSRRMRNLLILWLDNSNLIE